MNKIDIPQFVKDQLQKKTISPKKQKQVNLHRRFTSSQIENAANTKSIKSPVNAANGLQQLLKMGNKPQQSKAYSLMQESFSLQYLKEISYTPCQQATQNFFKKCPLSQNSTMSSVKPRMQSANKELLKKQPPHSHRETITQLQDILIRTNSLLMQYQNQIAKQITEKEELTKIILQLQQ